jgi:hypothetical protein
MPTILRVSEPNIPLYQHLFITFVCIIRASLVILLGGRSVDVGLQKRIFEEVREGEGFYVKRGTPRR